MNRIKIDLIRFADNKLIMDTESGIVEFIPWGAEAGCWFIDEKGLKANYYFRWLDEVLEIGDEHPNYNLLNDFCAGTELDVSRGSYYTNLPVEHIFTGSEDELYDLFPLSLPKQPYREVNGDIFNYYMDLQKYYAFRKVKEKIPRDIVCRLYSCKNNRYELLLMFNHMPESIKLYNFSNMLGYLVANCRCFNDNYNSTEKMGSLLNMSLPNILDELGFPSDKESLRLLRKVYDCDSRVEILIFIRELLNNRPDKRLNLIKHNHIEPEYLYCLMHGFPVSFVSDVIQKRASRNIDPQYIIEKIFQMKLILNRMNFGIEFYAGKINSYKKLEKEYRDLLRSCRITKERYSSWEFTEFPFKATRRITPVKSLNELRKLSVRLNVKLMYCVGEIIFKECAVYAYSSDREGEAIIITNLLDGKWVVTDIVAEYYQNVSHNVLEQVMTWAYGADADKWIGRFMQSWVEHL